MTEIFTIEIEIQEPLTMEQRLAIFSTLKRDAQSMISICQPKGFGPDVDPTEQVLVYGENGELA